MVTDVRFQIWTRNLWNASEDAAQEVHVLCVCVFKDAIWTGELVLRGIRNSRFLLFTILEKRKMTGMINIKLLYLHFSELTQKHHDILSE